MLVQITDVGVALMEAATEPLVMTSYKLGGDFGYIPTSDQTDILGTEVYDGVPAAPEAGTNTILYSIQVPEPAGPFQFGEIGLFYGAQLFAICVLDELMTKAPLNVGTNTGGAIVSQFFVPIVSTNYQMWAAVSQANTIKASTVSGPEGLPQSPNATPNLFVVEPAGTGQTFMAFSDRVGIWNFTGFARVETATVVAADANSITVTSADVSDLTFLGLGTLLMQVTGGTAYSIVRYVDGVTPSGANTVLSFNAGLTVIPNVGDTLALYEPTTVSTPTGAAEPGEFTTLSSTGSTSLGPTQAQSLNNTPVGATTPSTGAFTTLASSGAATLGPLIASAINSTPIGATTPSTARFTTLEVTTTLSGAGVATRLAAPGPIGLTTPAAAAFTDVTISGILTVSGIDIDEIEGTAIGLTIPAAAAFTTLSAAGATTLASLTVSGVSALQAVTATTVGATGALTAASAAIAGALTAGSINSTSVGLTTAAAGAFTTLQASGTTTLGVTNTGLLTASGINSTPIGATTPSTGVFTSLTVSGALVVPAINNTTIGATTRSTGAFTTLASTGATTTGGLVLSSTTSPITLNASVGTAGQVLTSAGAGATPTWTNAVTAGTSVSFSSLNVTGATTLASLTAAGINSTPIGATTPAAGTFTSLNAATLALTSTLSLGSGILLTGSQGTSGQVLTSAGAGVVPTWTNVVAAGSSPTFPAITVSGTATLATANVTTSTITTLTATNLITGNTPFRPNGLTGGTGQILVSQGGASAPQWQNLVVSVAAITSGTINNASVGATTPASGAFTSLALPGASAPITLNASVGSIGQVLTSQGAGATPIWTTPATGGSGTVAITGGTIDGVTIGATTPGSGVFTSLGVSGTATVGVLSATSIKTTGNTAVEINGAVGSSGQVLTSQGAGAAPQWLAPVVTIAAITSGTINGVTFTASTVNSTPIGGTTPAPGTFTQLALASTTSPVLLNGAPGTAGQVLTSAGAGATPTWVDPAAVLAPSSAAGTLTLNLATTRYFTVALTENVTTITLTNVPAGGSSLLVRFTQDATARTVAWPAAFDWAGGTPGTVSTGSGDIDVLELRTFNGGTSWMARLSNDFS